MPWTRQQLIDTFFIEDRTVRKTLHAIGANIKDKEYSDEVYERFKRAREMIDGGASFDDVKRTFNVVTDEEDNNTTPEESDPTALVKLTAEGTASIVGAYVEKIVSDLATNDVLPALIEKTLINYRTQFKASFTRYTARIKEQANSYVSTSSSPFTPQVHLTAIEDDDNNEDEVSDDTSSP
ncbi:hypothetical protein HCG51_08835 [Tolypothrix sp. PCC 7910]|uniref:hypothetical protein n=1 Tax=Tolypothrix sp. PCC 7910 TaxID=2099387 RepID=UPI0014278DE1|nr:hypothetical protein [Tolypothrix sp. PCC 7910]QIR36835.1 hypothetical protein HCG51_08835 [Tolypothrix sp. PCC 7910]